jgi:hypothetical protein
MLKRIDCRKGSERKMKSSSTFAKLFVLAAIATSAARAAIILDVSSALVAGDSPQLGRLSRNGIAQDWVGSEPFPGVINPAVSYHYHTYSVNVGNTPFIQIEFDSTSGNTFVSAYDTTYVPTALATNWLGDPGLSGNDFGTDTLFFQVIVPANHNLIVVVNQTATGTAGLGDPFRIVVEGFVDTEFTDPPAVPEPSTILLSGAGLAMLALGRRRLRMR